jgi:hypothetical protein
LIVPPLSHTPVQVTLFQDANKPERPTCEHSVDDIDAETDTVVSISKTIVRRATARS